jgi:hypothetical protein
MPVDFCFSGTATYATDACFAVFSTQLIGGALFRVRPIPSAAVVADEAVDPSCCLRWTLPT